MISTTSRPAQESRAPALMTTLVRTRRADLPVDVVLVAVRLALAWIFVYYGAGKLFGSFDGPGIHQTARFFADTAHLRPGGFWAVVGGVIEFGGALALVIGLAARLAALALVGDMVMAMITVTWTNGINSEKVPPGYELNVALAVLALVVVVLGAGRFSLDGLAARHLGVTER